MDTDKLFIGRRYDLKKSEMLEEPLLYDPDDLTTHGVVVGMTGSGKTGLCVDILEEAALQDIPALIIDPKGDIANLLLHFPDLKAEDFEPWVDPDEARRENISPSELAERISKLWNDGLDSWGIGSERIQKVMDAVDYAVYSPGSDAGIPVSIMASLEAPDLEWKGNQEAIREKISSTVTALLGLVGVEADPVQSREHILVANLFEGSWKENQDMDLTGLIGQIQDPPFKKLGALELEKFYPKDDRFKLAMQLNNLLASPSFEAWTEGVPLDIERLLWTPEGKPRHSVFYLAHLPDSERMFFVTLLLTAVEAWMRTQAGSSSLRALVYFDEALGYLPPVAMPPSKPPLLRLLKQARAFGLGILLTTQNPVDLDYKALSNAGTWFIGKLQTERDKQRLLDGLKSVEGGEYGVPIETIDRSISALGKRVFLLNNVHEKQPEIFHTRWAMAYLKGPITRSRLGDLNRLAGVSDGVSTSKPKSSEKPAAEGPSEVVWEGSSKQIPSPPGRLTQFFLPNDFTVSAGLKAVGESPEGVDVLGLVYKPSVLIQAIVRYIDRKTNLDETQTVTAIVEELDAQGFVRWDDWLSDPVDSSSLDTKPAPDARFEQLQGGFDASKTITSLKSDFVDYVYHDAGLELLANEALDLIGKLGVSKAEFQTQAERAAEKALQEEIAELEEGYSKKVEKIQDRIKKEERELVEDESEFSSRRLEELATHAENILGLFTGSRSRRRVSSSLTKRRMTSKAKADVEESMEVIETLQDDLVELEQALAEEMDEIEERWEQIASQIETTIVMPYKKNIRVELFGIAWTPYWRVQVGQSVQDVPGFSGLNL
ncbi:MAG: DUF87 domain-containing protein [Anaerolineales bacterium]